MDDAVPSWHSPYMTPQHGGVQGTRGVAWDALPAPRLVVPPGQTGPWGGNGQGHPLQPLIAPTPVGLHEDARRSHLCLAEPCAGLGTRGAQEGFKARVYPTPSDAVWTHSSPHPRGVKHSNPLGKKISCNSPRAQSCMVLSTPSQTMILEGNHPPLSPRCCLCPGGGHGRFRCLRTIGAVVPAGHASRCCRLPGTGSALTWEKRI